MSLRSRVALASSRCVQIAGCAIVAFGSAGVVAAAWARVAAGDPATAACLGAALVPVALAFAIGRSRSRGIGATWVAFDDRPDVDVWADAAGEAPVVWRLDASSTVWPGLSVLRLRRAGAGGRVASFCVVDGEAPADDARALRRFLLWSSHGSSRSGAHTDRRSR